MNGRTSNGTTIMATYASTSGSAAAATVSAGCAGDDHEHKREKDRFVYCMYKESHSFSLVFFYTISTDFFFPLSFSWCFSRQHDFSPNNMVGIFSGRYLFTNESQSIKACVYPCLRLT